MSKTERSSTENLQAGVDPSRRSFLQWVIGNIGAFMTAAVGVPIVGAVASAARDASKAVQVALHKLDDYPVNEPTLAQFTITTTDGWMRTLETRSVWVVRTGEKDVTVYNGRCTHLGCAYNWQDSGDEAEHFVCPCHDGVFALDGTVVDGPPPRPLDTLPVKIEDGVVMIEYEDFRPGIPKKTPV